MTDLEQDSELGTVDAGEDVDPRYIVPGLVRGLAVLQLFRRQKPALTLAEIAAECGLSRSAAFRLVYTLEKEGYLRRDTVTRRYELASKVMSLGFAFLQARPLTDVAAPTLRRLSEITQAASHLVQLDRTYAVYVARATPAAALVSNLQVGTRLPAHATASGRVLLSGLDEAAIRDLHAEMRREHRAHPPPPLKEVLERARQDRRQGFVMSESIFDPGVLSFASPVFDGTGAIVAAINVVGPRGLMRKIGEAADFDAIVGEAARALSTALGPRLAAGS